MSGYFNCSLKGSQVYTIEPLGAFGVCSSAVCISESLKGCFKGSQGDIGPYMAHLVSTPSIQVLIPYHTIPYHTIPYHTIPYHTIPYHTIPYHTIPYHTIPYYTILYYTILYYTILYYTILYYTILYYTILYYTILYYTILYCTVLYCTVLYCTVLYYTILYWASSRRPKRGPPQSFKPPAAPALSAEAAPEGDGVIAV